MFPPAAEWSTWLEDLTAAGVTRITEDSREVIPGAVFVAVEGAETHLAEARARGVLATVGRHPNCDWVVEDPRRALAQLAAAYHGHPSRALRVIGITGTSGKTTTAFLLRAIFQSAGYSVGLLGSVETTIGGKTSAATLTTPPAPELQSCLQRMRLAGDQVAILEVSSHALHQRRADEIAYDAMIFTNLSPEHLDYHRDLEDYYQAKKRLFTELRDHSTAVGKQPISIVESRVSSWGERLRNELGPNAGMRLRDFCAAENLELGASGLRGDFRVDAETALGVRSPLLGRFNALNIGGAIRTALEFGIEPKTIIRALEEFALVPGRLERIPHTRGCRVWVDFAHKPEALAQVLKALHEIRDRERAPGVDPRIVCVFGCGGNRDRSKRPLMGEIGAQLADVLVITSDNPRREDPSAIIREIVAGITTPPQTIHVEVERKRAIHWALRTARQEDLVLIAGKGHEKVQICGDRELPFDDVQVVRELLAREIVPRS